MVFLWYCLFLLLCLLPFSSGGLAAAQELRAGTNSSPTNITDSPAPTLPAQTPQTLFSISPPLIPSGVCPPELPARPPIPPPPAEQAALPPSGVIPKEPLSWRARALKQPPRHWQAPQFTRPLSASIGDSRLQGVPKAKPDAQRTFKASLDETITAVASACRLTGLSVNKIDSSAGLLIASSSGDSAEISCLWIKLTEQLPARTTVSLSSSKDAPAVDRSVLKHLLALTADTLDNHDRLHDRQQGVSAGTGSASVGHSSAHLPAGSSPYRLSNSAHRSSHASQTAARRIAPAPATHFVY